MSSNSGSSDNLADALSSMADGEPRRRTDAADHAAAADADAGIETGPSASAGGSSSGAGRRTRRPPKPSDAAKLGVRASLIIGGLLLIPGIWAVLVLAGVDVFNANVSGARAMAALMLLSWPIGGALIGGALFFQRQLARQQAEYDRAIAREREDAGGS